MNYQIKVIIDHKYTVGISPLSFCICFFLLLFLAKNWITVSALFLVVKHCGCFSFWPSWSWRSGTWLNLIFKYYGQGLPMLGSSKTCWPCWTWNWHENFWCLKLLSAIFYFCHQIYNTSKTMKNVFYFV